MSKIKAENQQEEDVFRTEMKHSINKVLFYQFEELKHNDAVNEVVHSRALKVPN